VNYGSFTIAFHFIYSSFSIDGLQLYANDLAITRKASHHDRYGYDRDGCGLDSNTHGHSDCHHNLLTHPNTHGGTNSHTYSNTG
jgi:hypothetical protein